jgi:hypothetical protein
MVRYLMVKKEKLLSGGLRESFYTILGDSHELEMALCAGGSGEDQYEIHSLIGVEIVDKYSAL